MHNKYSTVNWNSLDNCTRHYMPPIISHGFEMYAIKVFKRFWKQIMQHPHLRSENITDILRMYYCNQNHSLYMRIVLENTLEKVIVVNTNRLRLPINPILTDLAWYNALLNLTCTMQAMQHSDNLDDMENLRYNWSVIK